jgi:predicted component of type VI protein secretion system
MSVRLPSVFEPLDQAADAIIAQATGDIHVKQQILASLEDGVAELANAVSVLTWNMFEAGYNPQIVEPIQQSSDALRASAHTCGDGWSALHRLLNMTVGELAASGQRAPDSTELNGGH